MVTWSYTPPGFPAGLVLSLAAAAIVFVFLLACLVADRARKLMSR